METENPVQALVETAAPEKKPRRKRTVKKKPESPAKPLKEVKSPRKRKEKKEIKISEKAKRELEFHKSKVSNLQDERGKILKEIISEYIGVIPPDEQLDPSKTEALFIDDNLPRVEIASKIYDAYKLEIIPWLDGSRDCLIDLSQKLEHNLSNRLPSKNWDKNLFMEIVDLATTKESITDESTTIEFFVSRNIDELKNCSFLEKNFERGKLRRRKLIILEKLDKLLEVIKKSEQESDILKIDKRNNDYTRSKEKLTQEAQKFERIRETKKKENERIEEKKIKLLAKEEDRRKREEERKKKELEKQIRDEEDRKIKEEERKKKEEQKRIADQQAAAAAALLVAQKPQNQLLTNFFGIKNQEKEEKMDEEIIVQSTDGVWGRGLGCVPVKAVINETRINSFESFLKSIIRAGEGVYISKQKLENAFRKKCAEFKEEKSLRLKRKQSRMRLSSQPQALPSETFAAPRFVLIKHEDFHYDFIEKRGYFRAPLPLPSISGRAPCLPDAQSSIEYDFDSDSAEDEGLGESLNSEEEGDSDIDGEEEDDFVVPDGYLSDEEAELDEDDKKFIRNKEKRKEKQSKDKSIKNGVVFDLREWVEGADIYIDEMNQQLRVINLTGREGFPIKIEAERAEMDIEPELMIELIHILHGIESKMLAINMFKSKFEYISRQVVKSKIDEMCCYGLYTNPEIYIQIGSSIDEYKRKLMQVFIPENQDVCPDIPSTQKEVVNLTTIKSPQEEIQHPTTEPEQEKMIEEGTKKSRRKDKTLLDMPDLLFELGECIHGTCESLYKAKNKYLSQFIERHQEIPKGAIMKKARHITRSGYLVKPEIFAELKIENDFERILSSRFLTPEDNNSRENSSEPSVQNKATPPTKDGMLSPNKDFEQKPILPEIVEVKETQSNTKATLVEDIHQGKKKVDKASISPIKSSSKKTLSEFFGKK